MKEITKIIQMRQNKVSHLSVADINSLLYACSKTRNPVRNRTLIKLSFNYGLRSSEVSTLLWDHIDFLEKKILLKRCKGSDNTICDLNYGCLEALRKHKKEAIKRGDGFLKDYVFKSEQGQKMRAQTIRDMINSVKNLAKLDKHITHHVLKHSCATFLKNQGCDEEEIQNHLGHKSVKNTRLYIHSDKENCIHLFN